MQSIADAVLTYSVTLAQQGATDVIDVPDQSAHASELTLAHRITNRAVLASDQSGGTHLSPISTPARRRTGAKEAQSSWRGLGKTREPAFSVLPVGVGPIGNLNAGNLGHVSSFRRLCRFRCAPYGDQATTRVARRGVRTCLERSGMRYLMYGGLPVLVGDATGEAVLSYAAALAQSRLTDIVRVPTVGWDGIIEEAPMLLGPGIPVLMRAAPEDELEPDDENFVQDLEIRTMAVLQGTFHYEPGAKHAS
jgi:hypothetical protein